MSLLLSMELVFPLVDHTCYFRHAPVRLRVAANMYGCACGYVAVSCCNAALVTRKLSTQTGPLLPLSGVNY